MFSFVISALGDKGIFIFFFFHSICKHHILKNFTELEWRTKLAGVQVTTYHDQCHFALQLNTYSFITTHLEQYSVAKNLQQVLDKKLKTIVKFSGVL